MKIFKFIIVFSLCLCASLYGKAQSLADIAASADLTLNGEAQMPVPEQKEAAEAVQTTALTVARLPDIKLNEDSINKSVIKYSYSENLNPARADFETGATAEALKQYSQAAKDETLAKEVKASAAVQSALLYMQQAEFKKAAEYAAIAAQQDEQNPFYQLVNVWAYAAQNNPKQARKEYNKLLFLTADFEYLTSAKLAVAMADFYNKNYTQSYSAFENLYGTDPYVISHAIFMMGRMNYIKEAYKTAQTLFEQALTHDPQNYAAQKYLAYNLKELKQFVPAWQTFASLYVLDTQDKELGKQIKSLSEYIKGDPKDYLYYTKLKEIYSTTPSPSDSPQLRVALFTGADGEPTNLQSFSFITANGFSIKDDSLGKVISAPAFTSRDIIFDAEHSAAIIQSRGGNTEFATKRPFVIEPDIKGSSILIKNAQGKDVFAANTGDKELRGNILVIPHKEGLTLVNYTTVEDALPAMLMSAARGEKSPQALQALAVVIRTKLAAKIAENKNIFDVSDNDRQIPYGGINMQADYTANAAKATAGETLSPAEGVDFYRSCSAAAKEEGLTSSAMISYPLSPENIFKFMLSNPPANLISAPQDPTLWSAVKWVYTIPAKEVQARLKKYNIGTIKYIQPAALSKEGRVLSVTFSGTKKTIELPFEEANFLLSAGTLRSNFFFIIPFGKQGKAKEFLLLGSETGQGKGLCIDGAVGLDREGKTKEEILSYYLFSYRVIK
jgi:peptidoglycan hydrolase-like amidase/tetratricopeptide (TPR) repeat protein